MKQTESGEIPKDWDVTTLENISNKMQNGLFYEPSRKGKGIPLINVGDMYKSSPIKISELDLFEANAIEKNIYQVKDGDLFFTRSSVVASGIAYSNIYLAQNKKHSIVFDSHLIKISPNTNIIDPKYLYLNCVSPLARKHFISVAKSAIMTTIDQQGIKSCPVILPPKPEQTAIATVLSDMDKLIQATEQLIHKKQQIKTATMQNLLTGKVRLAEFDTHATKNSELGEIPSDWEVVKLGDITKIKTGSRNNQDKISEGKYPFFVRSATVERINSFSYDCEAILIPGEGGIGSIFHYINGKFDAHQRVYVIRDFINCHAKFIYYAMVQSFGKHAMENSVKATVDSLRLPTFLNFEFILPRNIKEQTTIAQILTDMDDEITQLNQRLEKLNSIKQGSMQTLLTGKIRLPTHLME